VKELKYPNGSFISYCDEYYKILQNSSDYSATVLDMGGDECRNFYFKAYGETSQLITDKKKTDELNNLLESVLDKNKQLP